MLTAIALSTSAMSSPFPQVQASDLSKGRIMFLGDSITMAGYYVSDIEYVLNVKLPRQQFDLISVGLASETLSGLSESVHPFPRPCVHDRLWAALDMVKPKFVFACYGINDGIYHPLSEDRFKAFKDGVKKLLAINKAAGVKTILLTPPPFDPIAAGGSLRPATAPDFSWMNVYEGYDDVVQKYGEWEKTLDGPDVQVVDVHEPVMTYVQAQRRTHPRFTLSGDGVHMNELGHWLMAKAVLKSLGINDADLPYQGDFALIQADPIYKLVAQRRQLRSDAWLPYIGYVRGEAFKSTSVDRAEILAIKLQSQIDVLRKKSNRS